MYEWFDEKQNDFACVYEEHMEETDENRIQKPSPYFIPNKNKMKHSSPFLFSLDIISNI